VDVASLKVGGDLPPGTLIWATRRGESRHARVIERRQHADDEFYDYYVHYFDFNRRMDEWITKDAVERIDVDGSLDVLRKGEKERIEAEKRAVEQAARKRQRKDDTLEAIEEEHGENDGMDEASLLEHEEVTKVKNINKLELGRYVMDTWYFSPFPREIFPDGSIDRLYVCEFCLSFFKAEPELRRHSKKCPLRHPPGNEIYRHEGMSVWEVDGSVEKVYCQNLCYIAKLFLDHKTLYYDVDLFLMYVFCEVDEYGMHIVGYYSKERYSEQGYNLACILALPPYQRKGYGRFIIQFSYELSKKEGKVGSPEKPLSDLGQLSYRSYWSWVLLNELTHLAAESVSIMDLTVATSITSDDIVKTLQYLNLIKYWNGNHVISISPELVDEKLKKLNSKPGPRVDPSKLHWAPLHVHVKRDKWSIRAKLHNRDDA